MNKTISIPDNRNSHNRANKQEVPYMAWSCRTICCYIIGRYGFRSRVNKPKVRIFTFRQIRNGLVMINLGFQWKHFRSSHYVYISLSDFGICSFLEYQHHIFIYNLFVLGPTQDPGHQIEDWLTLFYIYLNLNNIHVLPKIHGLNKYLADVATSNMFIKIT